MPTSKPAEINIEPLNDGVTPSPSVQGWQIPLAPIKKMTIPDGNLATGTYSPGTATIINNTVTRVDELEAALVKLNLLKSR